MRFFILPSLAFGSALCLVVAACAVSYPIAPADASAGGSASGGFSATGGNGGTGGTGGIAGTGATGGNGGADAGTGGTGGIAGTGGTGGLDGGTDASTGGTGGATTSGTSCQTPGPGLTDCGPGKESCCTSPLVKGGTFYRSYDGVTYTDKSYPATVSNFRLDKYEITVGRFRKFVTAWDKGWRPAAGSGKHAYLNGGKGLSDSSKPGSYEPGWDTSWNTKLAGNKATWDSNLSCNSSYQTWTSNIASNERRPINCVDGYETAAFCIWDGGFLPSEAEWNYAASGGSEQRVYPWSSPPLSTTVDCSYANYYSCPGGSTNDVGSESPKGDGKWGQSDLAGNVWDWILDQYSPYAVPCNNCAYLASSSYRVARGGSFGNVASSLLASYRGGNTPVIRGTYIVARCARTP